VINERLINKYVYGAFILALGLLLFSWLKEFLSSLLGAIVFYMLFRNLMHFFVRKGINKGISALIIIFISFVIVIIPISILATVIYNKAAMLVENPQPVVDLGHKLLDKLRSMHINVSDDGVMERIRQFISENAGKVLNSSVGVLGGLIMMYFFLFFLLANYQTLDTAIINYLPFRKSKIMLFSKELADQTYSNAIGVPLVAVSQGFAGYLSFRIAGVPEAGVWAILAGFASIIPLVGTGLIWVPVTVWLFAENKIWQGTFVGLYSVILMTHIDNIIRMILSRRIGNVHPIVTVLGVLVGLRYFGLPGLVFGPLIISYFLILIRLYHQEYIHKPDVSPEPVKKEASLLGIIKALQKNLFKKRMQSPPGNLVERTGETLSQTRNLSPSK
jgi:predicted PurR-regulated permease PerM